MCKSILIFLDNYFECIVIINAYWKNSKLIIFFFFFFTLVSHPERLGLFVNVIPYLDFGSLFAFFVEVSVELVFFIDGLETIFFFIDDGVLWTVSGLVFDSDFKVFDNGVFITDERGELLAIKEVLERAVAVIDGEFFIFDNDEVLVTVEFTGLCILVLPLVEIEALGLFNFEVWEIDFLGNLVGLGLVGLVSVFDGVFISLEIFLFLTLLLSLVVKLLPAFSGDLVFTFTFSLLMDEIFEESFVINIEESFYKLKRIWINKYFLFNNIF